MKLFLVALFAGSSLSSAALAQAAGGAGPSQLEEIVVTATRQIDTVNKVPLSIAAVTQQTIFDQGLRNPTDLTRTVPGLNVTGTNVGVATFAIRGIVGGTGAATTGVYLNDTALQKRSNGGNVQNNGAPLGPLFDLERVEVLKGPQGTLYGGSSQGGTIRFITPTPSVTTYSATAQLEASQLRRGETGFRIGVAGGGPIIEDRLGFRVSYLSEQIAGNIDAYSPYTGQVIKKDSNTTWNRSYRLALLWKINDRATAELAHYGASTTYEGGPTTITEPLPKGQTFTTPRTCNSTTRTVPLLNAFGQPQGAVPTNVPCPASPTPGVYIRPSSTFGPFDYLDGYDDALLTTLQGTITQPTRFSVSNLTLTYDFDTLSVKSITSYIEDKVKSQGTGAEEPFIRQTTTQGLNGVGAGAIGFPLFGLNPFYNTLAMGRNKRHGIQQEVRFSSPADQRPFSWVAGLYYSNQRTHTGFSFTGSPENTINLMYGVSAFQRYGIDNTCNGWPCGAVQDATFKDVESAAFGEGNYWLTDRLKLIAGVRFSRVELTYYQRAFGQYTARLPDNPLGLTQGSNVNSPITPKFGLQYDVNASSLVYASASKGFRAGGVNPQVSATQCQIGLQTLNITANDIPPSYDPDTVWSYEAGGKFRLLDGRAQLNVAAYRIDWSGVQATVAVPGCGQSFVMNGGRARSEGVDLQAQVRPIQPLTLTANVGYNNARYIDPVAGPVPAPGVRNSINAGDKFAVPPWQVSLSGEYRVNLTDKYQGFARLDYQYQSRFKNGTSYGTGAYNPFTYIVPGRDVVNARAGVSFDKWQLNVFANNLLDGQDKVGNGGNGRSACAVTATAACEIYGFFNPFVSQGYQRPREVGVQANYRF